MRNVFFAGAAVGGTLVAIFLAAFALPQWESIGRDAKAQGCTALGANFEPDGNRVYGGQCVKGNTIVLRFKD